MLPNLYQLKQEYIDLCNALMSSTDEDGVVDDAIAEALDKVTDEFVEKAGATGYVCRQLDNYSSEIAAEIKRLQTMKKVVDNNRARLENYLDSACRATGIMSIQGVYSNISYRKSKATIIDDLDKVPKKYKRIKYEADKSAIKAAIESGIAVRGAHIEEHNNIQIK